MDSTTQETVDLGGGSEKEAGAEKEGGEKSQSGDCIQGGQWDQYQAQGFYGNMGYEEYPWYEPMYAGNFNGYTGSQYFMGLLGHGGEEDQGGEVLHVQSKTKE